MLCCFGFRPEGVEQISPGQRPWNGNSRGKQAAKGETIEWPRDVAIPHEKPIWRTVRRIERGCFAPSGLGFPCLTGSPRAMHWANLWLPLRGGEHTAQQQYSARPALGAGLLTPPKAYPRWARVSVTPKAYPRWARVSAQTLDRKVSFVRSKLSKHEHL
jgi:hypothetical protein